MKKIYLTGMFAAIGSFTAFAQSTNPSPYCVASYDDGEFMLPRAITEVRLESLVNTTGETQFSAPHYVYYNNLAAPTLVKGQSHTITVKTVPDQIIHFVAAFIDFNGNNQFDLASEMILGKTIHYDEMEGEYTVSFTVPMDAISGITRLRVMAFVDDVYTWEDNNTAFLACTAFNGGQIDSGETEDYNVQITGGASVGVSTLEIAPEFRLAPNPSNGLLNVTDAMKGAKMEVLSVDGSQLFMENELTVDRVDLSHLPKGTVIVRLYTKETVVVQKVNLF